MMHTGKPDTLRAVASRVALTATLIVALGYCVVGVTIYAIVSITLTSQIDARLQSSIATLQTEYKAGEPPRIGEPANQPGPHFGVSSQSNHYGPPLLIWVVSPFGVVEASDPNATLPSSDLSVGSPTTITSANSQFRIDGAAFGQEYIILGESTASISEAQSILFTSELLVGPFLLILVFFGSLIVGQRVALPIETARVRQMAFTADASHELRTPLAVIEAQTFLALSTKRTSTWYKDAFTQVQHESGRIRRVVEDLLWLARLDSTSGDPKAELVDVGVLAEHSVPRFTPVAELRHQSLTFSAAPSGAMILASAEWIDRLMNVLMDNACKYTPENGTIHVDVAIEANRVVLSVEDSGPGIPTDELGHLFDRFHRATSAPGGSGLGLSIANAIVQATGARWVIATSPLGGASMQVSWSRASGAS